MEALGCQRGAFKLWIFLVVLDKAIHGQFNQNFVEPKSNSLQM
uniref:Uncharacterized protein n=1 Tax=Rhizophora mucronata TaxID=61149 RepID=A0A2P2PCX1_RHIMU